MFITRQGKQGNIERLERAISRTQAQVYNNKAETDAAILEADANLVEMVIDEFYATIGEEREEENV